MQEVSMPVQERLDGLHVAELNQPEFRQLLQQCVHCGLCLQVCPTYGLFGTEMDSPRGRISLIRAAADGLLNRDEFLGSFSLHINLCLACRTCETACPSGVEYGRLVEGARAAIEQHRQPGTVERTVRRAAMQELMPDAGKMRGLERWLRLYQQTGLQWLTRAFLPLPKTLQVMEGILPPIEAEHFDYSKPAPAHGEKRGTVAFFQGCIQEAFLAQANAATVRVLQRNGYEVHFPAGQTCCGAAQLHTGDEVLARQLAQRNIDAFLDDGFDAIINNAGGCGLTLQEYPHLFSGDHEYAEKAKQFSDKVMDFSQFIHDNLVEPPRGELRVRAMYSDSCHLRHGQKVAAQPRALLNKIPGLELIEPKDPDRCCGSAGIYNITQPDPAQVLLDERMADAARSGVRLIVSNNTGCHMQLLNGARRSGLKINVMHIAEVLDLSYRAGELAKPRQWPRPLFGHSRPPHSTAGWLAWLGKRRNGAATNGAVGALQAYLKSGQLIDQPAELRTYSTDAGLAAEMPVGVALALNRVDVQKIMKWAYREQVPVVARGSGTGFSGGAVADGGLILETSQMKELVEFDQEGRSVVLQPGFVTLNLDEMTRKSGLYYPPDPASGRTTTLGGNLAFNSGGPHCFKYGVTTNYVTGVEVVLANGDAVRFGGRCFDYPEIDLTGLMVGSEGTLGVITEAMLSLRRFPPAVMTMMAGFETVEDAGKAVSAVIRRGLTPSTLEMMDQMVMQIVEDFVHPGLPVDAGAMLIIEADGYLESVKPQIEEFAAALKENQAVDVQIAETPEQRAKIWFGRKSAIGALARLAPAYSLVDGTVPRSKLAQALNTVTRICTDLGLRVGYVFHAGDGNLHPLILIDDPNDAELIERVEEAGRQVCEYCVELGGSITGEHGVGSEKREFMLMMFNADELSAMADIKTVFDPDGLLNPGKLFPEGKPAPAGPLPLMVPEGDVFAPANTSEAAGVVRAWRDGKRSIRIASNVNGGAEEERVLSTERMEGVLEFSLDDLYVTAGSGTLLGDLQQATGEEGMWTPLVSPWASTTVGGLVSGGLNAPLRMRYGGIRDLVQTMKIVLPDGRVVQTGRPLMKNVAGYDLVKLFVGSRGALGLITEVTFRLLPLPRGRKSVFVAVQTVEEGLRWGKKMLKLALAASAVLLVPGETIDGLDAPLALVYTVEGTREDVAAEIELLRELLQEAGAPEAAPCRFSGSDLWVGWLGSNQDEDTLVRVGVPPKDLADLVKTEEGIYAARGGFMADFASGMVYLRSVQRITEVRRSALSRGGYAVIFDGVEEGIDPWGYQPEGLALMRAIKARWDPENSFNPGTFIV
jgi:D-lactate dehydrogenase (cytochrome)